MLLYSELDILIAIDTSKKLVTFSCLQGHLSTGSFYMRLGAVGFGIGSMIHDALRFGDLIETKLLSIDGEWKLSIVELLECHGTQPRETRHVS